MITKSKNPIYVDVNEVCNDWGVKSTYICYICTKINYILAYEVLFFNERSDIQMEVIASGNAIVDAIGMMNFTGNVIPEAWYSELRFKSGKPHMNAIMILSDIVYWYRPRESRNEYDGTVVFEKKFKDEEYLQRSYKQISEKFGISEGQAKSAIVFLEKDIGVIIRHFKKITNINHSLYQKVKE